MVNKLTVLVAGSTGIFDSKIVSALNLMKKYLIALLGILIAIVVVTSPAIAAPRK
jgi:hypothetical protein